MLPMARPALAVGIALVLLETLNDIGASEFLGVQTLTTAIHTTWVTRGDLAGAAQIALALLALVLALIALERHGRRRQRFAAGGQRLRAITPQPLAGRRGLLATLLCALPVLLGFAVPATFLAWQAFMRWRDAGLSPGLLAAAGNTVQIALVATVVTVAIGLALAWGLRLLQARTTAPGGQAAFRLATLGYALPGTVLALGLMAVLGGVDAALGRALLMGSFGALVAAHVLRFLAVSAGTLDAGFARVPASLDQAAASLGAGGWSRLWRVQLPLLRPALTAAALLVLVDSLKELPATLMLRPMNFETLSTWLYAEAARGSYEDGAVAGLLIVAAGLLPVAWLARNGLDAGVGRRGGGSGDAG